ncbi:putative mediator of RNA polymerase II transcription subunit 26 [Hyposmocoma kahamanoa]|uniref:putative mediator of RNA polymerase II transcription subunit 26 n=1 Tax=Hyposmocoma kahamanoa TaxID=1477025 RepID=UPI000E6D5F2F|nr:putative mediator of RNA polymerase II transcription subunit 26 [Hyposmocoma kahamanoa]
MQRIKYIQNHNHQVLNQYQQQQQHGQGFEQQAYNNELTNQGHQQELSHQFQNHQLQNYLLGPQEIQTAPLSLHQIQAPQLQHQIQEQIAPQIQPQSYDHQISVPLQPPPHQELQLHENIHQGLSYGGHRQGRPGEKSAKIVGYKFEKEGPNYRYAYETENGIKAQEAGTIGKGSRVQGGYSYKGDNGQTYTVQYIADEQGFRAQGAHLPTPPPIPEAIAKSLEQNAKDEAAGVFDNGKYRPQENQPQVYHQTQVDQQQIQAVHHQNQQYEVQYQSPQEDSQQYLQLNQQGQDYQHRQDEGYQQEQPQAYVAPAAVYENNHQ